MHPFANISFFFPPETYKLTIMQQAEMQDGSQHIDFSITALHSTVGILPILNVHIFI